ncbi:hypothetical protein HYFRA_00008773 [Hymenoscyphus fraxineus]|uniref:Rhodopsin domain-containing protein n=1 Tax=Hymenoscyphus fraxineus TaxID=746836 RepID=A0A9N9L1D3_9HELO|nr:hypothetical protein HYFRA_00008773 [Hymenoscyphus fraxineus]
MATPQLVSNVTQTFSTILPSGSVSAFLGTPPATLKDYYIASYFLFQFGLKTDPIHGSPVSPKRPPPEAYVSETNGPAIIASMIASIVVMVLITSIRLGIRLFNRGLMMGLDDLFIIPGVILAVAWPALQICAVVYGGAGKHMYDVTYEEYSYFKLYANVDKLLFFLAVGFIKLSICFFNRRLTSITSKPWRIFNNCFIAALVAYILLALFWCIFQCNPPYAGWNIIRVAKEVKHKPQCISDNVVGSGLSVIHALMDFGLLSVPLIILWKVQMNWMTKARLFFVFSIGGMSAIGSVVRQVEQERLKGDILFNFVPLQNWTLIDLTFGVVAASLPILSAFIPKSWKSAVGSKKSTHPSNGYFKKSGHAKLQSGRDGRIGKGSGTESDITRTDVIELTYQDKKDLGWDNVSDDTREVAESLEIVGASPSPKVREVPEH